MNAVQWILLAHATGIVLDAYWAFDASDATKTISYRMKYVSATTPLWLYSFTMLAGHFGLPLENPPFSYTTGVLLLAGTGVLWFAAGTWLRGPTLTYEEIFWTNIIAINTGWLAGMLLWPQSPIQSIPALFQ